MAEFVLCGLGLLAGALCALWPYVDGFQLMYRRGYDDQED